MKQLKLRGSPSAVLDEISSNPVYGFAQVSISTSGELLYRKGRTEGLRTINWLNSDGKTEQLAPDAALYQFPRFSPDGKRLATVVIEGSSSVIWIYDWERGAKAKLPTGNGVNTSPVWTPNGRYLVYQSPGGMFWSRVDGTSVRTVLTKSDVLQFPTSFSPDGKYLVFVEANPGPGANLRTVRVEENAGQLRAGIPELLVQLPSLNAFTTFSADGNWIAYASAESGIYEVYVRHFPDNGAQAQISVNGGTMPVWNPKTHELYYRTEDERIMAVAYAIKGNIFVPEKPKQWSPTRLANLGLTPNFDLHPGGVRFAVLMPSEPANTRERRLREVLVIHFIEELRRRVPFQR